MVNDPIDEKPVWERPEEGHTPDRGQCQRGEHTWVAFFFQSGRLAYWQCIGCGKTDRDTGQLPERLELINSWVESPPQLIARGPTPPASDRRWITSEGTILVEGDPSSIHFVGEAIPGLDQAHTYAEYDENDQIKAVYEPSRERPWEYYDHYWLTRYQVVGETLVQFQSRCYEESTYDTPTACEAEQTVILSGLRLL